MDATVYNTKGKEAGKVTLPESVFAVAWNTNLVHQVVTAMQANARTPIAHTKDRSEVSGTGKKPWKQKGTGNARHGSRRSPIWRTGGVAHGPRNEKSFAQKINKKMRIKTLYTVLSKKLEDGEILFVDSFALETPKTKDAKAMMSALAKIKGFDKLSTKRKNTALIAGITMDENTVKSYRNFGNLQLEEVRNLNPVDVLTYKYLILSNAEESVKLLAERAGKGKKESK